MRHERETTSMEGRSIESKMDGASNNEIESSNKRDRGSNS